MWLVSFALVREIKVLVTKYSWALVPDLLVVCFATGSVGYRTLAPAGTHFASQRSHVFGRQCEPVVDSLLPGCLIEGDGAVVRVLAGA